MGQRTPTPARPEPTGAPTATRPDGGNSPREGLADCPCTTRGAFHLTQEWHDWYLTVEYRGVPGLVELMMYVDGLADMEPSEGQLHWFDFREFVACHSWQHPMAMHDVAQLVDGGIRARLRGSPEEPRVAVSASAPTVDAPPPHLRRRTFRPWVEPGLMGAQKAVEGAWAACWALRHLEPTATVLGGDSETGEYQQVAALFELDAINEALAACARWAIDAIGGTPCKSYTYTETAKTLQAALDRLRQAGPA